MKRPAISRRIMSACILTALIPIVSGCGKKESKSDNAVFSVLPSQPIVITAPAKVGDRELKDPWFTFRVSAANNTGDLFTIVALKIDVAGITKEGVFSTSTKIFSPGDFPYSFTTSSGGATVTYACLFTHFGVFQVGESARLSLEGDATPGCAGREPLFFVEGAPAGIDNSSPRMNVSVKPLGWFGDYDNPTERFETKFKFKTQ